MPRFIYLPIYWTDRNDPTKKMVTIKVRDNETYRTTIYGPFVVPTADAPDEGSPALI